MKAIVLNTTQSKLSKRVEANTLKSGFLLCNEVYMAGHTDHEMFFKEINAGFSIEKKLCLLEMWNRDDPETLDMLKNIDKLRKVLKKIKHKQTSQLVMLRDIEKDISEMLNIQIQMFEDNMNKAGFQPLKELAEKHIIKSYRFGHDDELPREGVTASGILQRFFPSVKENEEPEIFFLGSEFFQNHKTESLYSSFASPESNDVQNTVLQHCFTFPDISKLSASELEMVRGQLLQSAAVFTGNMNEWIDMCYFDDVTERNLFFKNRVLSSVTMLQKAISENGILKLCRRTQIDDMVKLNLWLGEMPVWKLWKHYKTYEAISEKTWQKLEALQEAEAYKSRRWPVAILHMPGDLHAEQNYDVIETEIKQAKKYIAID